MTGTQEMRVEKDPTNKVFPNDWSAIEGRLQKVHDKPFSDRLIHACSCTGGRQRRGRVGQIPASYRWCLLCRTFAPACHA